MGLKLLGTGPSNSADASPKSYVDAQDQAYCPSGVIMPYAGISLGSAPSGWLFCDGSNVSRSTYSSLFTALTVVVTGTTTSGSTSVTGVSSTLVTLINNAYGSSPTRWQITGSNITGVGSIASASGTTLTLAANAAASGSTTLTVYPYGAGDGSTTFGLPNGANAMMRGNYFGDNGGNDTHSHGPGSYVATHDHTQTDHNHNLSGNGYAAVRTTGGHVVQDIVTTPNWNGANQANGSVGTVANPQGYGAPLGGATDGVVSTVHTSSSNTPAVTGTSDPGTAVPNHIGVQWMIKT